MNQAQTQVGKMNEALALFERRRTRNAHPDGKFDKGLRWYPSATEAQKCCQGLRSPSRAYPYSLMTHCRTLRHVCALIGADESAARKVLAKRLADARPARTAPTGICSVCGASWACEHQDDADRGRLVAIPAARADMDRHIGN